MSRRSKRELREEYLRWLEEQLTDEFSSSGKTYWGLVNRMFDTPFTYKIAMDHNRVMDGLDLRVEFAHSIRIRPPTMDALGPGSFLEVLVGLSRKLAFTAGGEASGWAWELLTNLELHRLYDPLTYAKQRKAEEIMHTVMDRTYLPDGTGGFFPLGWPDDDQTQIELWYQMHAFVGELHPEH